jgi:citrate lyase beta subunit
LRRRRQRSRPPATRCGWRDRRCLRLDPLAELLLTKLQIAELNEKDVHDLRWALRNGIDMVALSFVRSAKDIELVHQVMDEENRRVPVIAKIEKAEALEDTLDVDVFSPPRQDWIDKTDDYLRR